MWERVTPQEVTGEARARLNGQVNRTASLLVGIVGVLVGVVWTLQGVGLVGGSFMTGEPLWAVIGPIVAVVGLLLVLRSRRSPE